MTGAILLRHGVAGNPSNRSVPIGTLIFFVSDMASFRHGTVKIEVLRYVCTIRGVRHFVIFRSQPAAVATNERSDAHGEQIDKSMEFRWCCWRVVDACARPADVACDGSVCAVVP